MASAIIQARYPTHHERPRLGANLLDIGAHVRYADALDCRLGTDRDLERQEPVERCFEIVVR